MKRLSTSVQSAARMPQAATALPCWMNLKREHFLIYNKIFKNTTLSICYLCQYAQVRGALKQNTFFLQHSPALPIWKGSQLNPLCASSLPFLPIAHEYP